jgi:hypothetical protein
MNGARRFRVTITVTTLFVGCAPPPQRTELHQGQQVVHASGSAGKNTEDRDETRRFHCRAGATLDDESDDEDEDEDEGAMARFRFCIDASLLAQQQELPGIDHGPERHGVVVIDPQGRQIQFVSDEIVYRPAGLADLQAFLARYGGTVLRDGTPLIIPNNPRGATSAESSGFYLIHVDLARSSLSDLQKGMTAHHLTGQFKFSSLEAARLLALVGREANSGPNYIGKDHAAQIPEHPDGMGGNIDAATFNYLNGSAPLQTDVIRAWQYLRYKGFPPDNSADFSKWRPSVIAIADHGFALNPLDPTTRAPLNGNLDYGFFFQADVVDHDGTAGGTEHDFHGTKVFAAAAAEPANFFGVAGTGGSVVTPMLIRRDYSMFSWADAIRSAAVNGADVVVLSTGQDCRVGSTSFGSLCDAFEETFTALQLSITFATGYGPTTVVVSAGNDGVTASADVPCALDNVICVGAVAADATAESYSNFGSEVAIWAPDLILSTPNPDTVGQPLGASQLPIVAGTSIAAPFVGGVIALLRQLEKPRVIGAGFSTIQIKGFLQSTANPSPDTKVSPGIVNALNAVMAASPNQPPTIQITNPADGSQVVPNASLEFVSSVNDPEPGFPKFFPVTVQWSSDRDGLLCTGITCTPPKLSFGTHVITATATDAFGATASTSITIGSVAHTPSASITYPPSNAIFHSSQRIEFRGYATDDLDGILPPTALNWSSSIDGALGSGVDIFATLSVGTHVVTLAATNSAGLIGRASVTLQVLPGSDYPSVTILIPHDDSAGGLPTAPPGIVETLIGQATDPVDSSLPDSAFVWTDSVDGRLGTGKTINVTLSSVFGVVAPHTLTLTVTNAVGNAGTSQVTVLVGSIM